MHRHAAFFAQRFEHFLRLIVESGNPAHHQIERNRVSNLNPVILMHCASGAAGRQSEDLRRECARPICLLGVAVIMYAPR